MYDREEMEYSCGWLTAEGWDEPPPEYEIPRYDGPRLPKSRFTRRDPVRHVAAKSRDKERRMWFPRYSARG